MATNGLILKHELEILFAELELEQSSFRSHWRDIQDHILPRRARFSLSDTNRGERKNLKIIDSTGTLALRTLQSGMMSGITSPARQWFRLTTSDPELSEMGPVREWLDAVTRRMFTVFLRSNVYNSLPIVYGDMGGFGTSAMFVEEDFDTVIRTFPFPVGSYLIANDERLRVRVFFRTFRMTVRQIIEKFGRTAGPGSPIDFTRISQTVQNLWEVGHPEAWIDVRHAILPNEAFDPEKAEAKFKRFRSVYYERGFSRSSTSTTLTAFSFQDDKILSESGFDFFPVLAPRWNVTGEDVYGTNAPGMVALGDIRALQIMQKRKAQAVEKMVHPPMNAPASMRSQKATILSGDINYIDLREGQQGFRPVHEVNPRVAELDGSIREHQIRISRAFFEDLFLMLSRTDRREITAREIDERREEKLLALGPVLEQLNQDLLDPLIDITFNVMLRQGLIPEPPEELQGVTLRVEYISVMAQAQKLVGLAGIERLVSFVGQMATLDRQVLDKLKADKFVDEYAEIVGTSARLVASEEEVLVIRQLRAQAEQARQAAELAKQGAGTVRELSEAKTGEENALTQLLRQTGQAVPA